MLWGDEGLDMYVLYVCLAFVCWLQWNSSISRLPHAAATPQLECLDTLALAIRAKTEPTSRCRSRSL